MLLCLLALTDDPLPPAGAALAAAGAGIAEMIGFATLYRGLAIGPMSVVAPLASLAAGANALFALALTEGMISTVSVMGSLFPVTTVVLGAILLRERPGWLPAAGVAGVLVGVGLVTAFGGA